MCASSISHLICRPWDKFPFDFIVSAVNFRSSIHIVHNVFKKSWWDDAVVVTVTMLDVGLCAFMVERRESFVKICQIPWSEQDYKIGKLRIVSSKSESSETTHLRRIKLQPPIIAGGKSGSVWGLIPAEDLRELNSILILFRQLICNGLKTDKLEGLFRKKNCCFFHIFRSYNRQHSNAYHLRHVFSNMTTFGSIN